MGLHSFFMKCNHSEKEGQGKSQTLKTMKEATKENKHKVAVGTKVRPKAPEKP